MEIISPLLCDLEDGEQLHSYVILTDDCYHHPRSSFFGINEQDLGFWKNIFFYFEIISAPLVTELVL